LKYSNAIIELGSTAPDFLPRCIGPSRVCAFLHGKAHEVRQRHEVPQEIRIGRRLASAGYHEPIVSLLWTRPVQLSLHLAKLSF
jgi:hypothetical protein